MEKSPSVQAAYESLTEGMLRNHIGKLHIEESLSVEQIINRLTRPGFNPPKLKTVVKKLLAQALASRTAGSAEAATIEGEGIIRSSVSEIKSGQGLRIASGVTV